MNKIGKIGKIILTQVQLIAMPLNARICWDSLVWYVCQLLYVVLAALTVILRPALVQRAAQLPNCKHIPTNLGHMPNHLNSSIQYYLAQD